MLCAEEKKRFASAFCGGFLAHAYLIEGMSDEAKEDFISFCLPYILCLGGGRCGVCASCIKLASGNHPDLRYIGGEGKAANMEAVRRLISDSRMVPVEDGKKVYVLRCGEKLRREAQNALLKLLEEPPKQVVIFILTEKREALLPTIRSRCRIISLTDMPAPKRDKSSSDTDERVKRIMDKLFLGDLRFDFYIAMNEKFTREKLSLLLKGLEDAMIGVIKAKDSIPSEGYSGYAAHIGRTEIALMLDAVSDSRKACEGNANLSSLQMSLAVRLWDIKN